MFSSVRFAKLSFVGIAVVVVLAIKSSRAEASGCSDFTPGHRDCTVTEELGYCLTNAMDSYSDCLDGANFLQKAGCSIAYEVDFYGCYLASPIKSALD